MLSYPPTPPAGPHWPPLYAPPSVVLLYRAPVLPCTAVALAWFIGALLWKQAQLTPPVLRDGFLVMVAMLCGMLGLMPALLERIQWLMMRGLGYRVVRVGDTPAVLASMPATHHYAVLLSPSAVLSASGMILMSRADHPLLIWLGICVVQSVIAYAAGPLGAAMALHRVAPHLGRPLPLITYVAHSSERS